MFFKLNHQRTGGFTLLEMIFGMGIAVIVITSVVGFSVFGSRSLASLYSSCNLDQQNRAALDQLAKDLRAVTTLTSYSSNQFDCQDWDGSSLSYIYNPTNQTLTRIKGASSKVLLTDCTRLAFTYGTRNLSNGTFIVYPATSAHDAKTVTMNWACSRKFLGKSYEDMPQYTTFNIRSKQ